MLNVKQAILCGAVLWLALSAAGARSQVAEEPAAPVTEVQDAAASVPAESPSAATEPPPDEPEEVVYAVTFEVMIVPSEKSGRVTLKLGTDAGVLEWIRFHGDPARYTGFDGDGRLEAVDGDIQWTPDGVGSTLQYNVHIDHLRDSRSYDARCARRWAIMRGEDLVPVIRVRAQPGSRSRARLRLRLPEGWSAALPYARNVGGDYLLDNPRSRFDRPRGWFALGELGVLREPVYGVDVAIAGPRDHGQRRHDLLALLTWTMPELKRLFPDLPERLLIVGAGDPMWRGGLSGPRSLFLHADRPLISDDGSSPLLHELLHVMMRAQAGPGGDWIVEGLAELYSREILRRSGILSEERHRRYMAAIREGAVAAGKLRVQTIGPQGLNRAIVTLLQLDAELRQATRGIGGLDQVLALLAADRRTVTTSRLRAFAEQVAGRDLGTFFDTWVAAPRMPG